MIEYPLLYEKFSYICKMNCDTQTIKSGEVVKTPKVKYETLEEAIKIAKKINLKGKNIKKLNAYKCPHCFKYHVGRGNKDLRTSKIKPYWKDI